MVVGRGVFVFKGCGDGMFVGLFLSKECDCCVVSHCCCCWGMVVVRSWYAAVIFLSLSPRLSRACSQKAGALGVSSGFRGHFSDFCVGSFVALSVRMAANTPTCSADSGVSSCSNVQL